MTHRFRHQLPSPQVQRRANLRQGAFNRHQLGFDRGRHAPRNIVLQLENIGQLAIIVLGPMLHTARRAGQLRGNPQPVSRLLDTPFENITNTEIAADLGNLHALVLVNEA